MKKREIKKLKRYYVNYDDIYGERDNQKSVRTYGNATIEDYYSVFNDAAEESEAEKKSFSDILRDNKFLKLEYISMAVVIFIIVAGFLIDGITSTAVLPYELLSLPKSGNPPIELSAIVNDEEQISEITDDYGIKFYGLGSENMVCGTEILSLTMIMSTYIPDITPKTVYSNYIDKAANPSLYNSVRLAKDPADYFIGDPYTKGYGIFASGIYNAAIKIKDAYGLNIDIENISGANEATLIDYLNNGYKIIVWYTRDLVPADWESEYWHFASGKMYQWPKGETSGVIVDYTDSSFTVYDPAENIKKYDRKTLLGVWRTMGYTKEATSQAVAIK